MAYEYDRPSVSASEELKMVGWLGITKEIIHAPVMR